MGLVAFYQQGSSHHVVQRTEGNELNWQKKVYIGLENMSQETSVSLKAMELLQEH